MTTPQSAGPDPEALTEIWEKNYQRFIQTATRELTANRIGDRPSDVVSSVILDFLSGRLGCRDQEHAVAFLCAVIRNRARRLSSQSGRTISLDEGHDGYISERNKIQIMCEIKQDLERARVLIEAMPERRRQVFRMHVNGYQAKEIALRLGIAPKTVRRHLEIGRIELREQFW